MPTNLYGPNDNYDLETSHVLPALIRKFHLGKLAARGDWEGIKKDEARYGLIPKDIRAALGFSPDAPSATPHPPKVVLWGTGSPRREFLHVDDMADACIFLMNLPDEKLDSFLLADSFASNLKRSARQAQRTFSFLINLGSGQDQTIREIANLVAEIVGYKGDVIWDNSKPDGTPRKLLDVTKINTLSWKSKISLEEGIQRTYKGYAKQSR